MESSYKRWKTSKIFIYITSKIQVGRLLNIFLKSKQLSGSSWDLGGISWELTGNSVGIQWEYGGSMVGVDRELIGSKYGVGRSEVW